MSVAITDSPSASVAGRRQTFRLLLLLAAGVELLVLYAPTAQWLYGRWTMSVWQHAHGLLIPPAVAWFCYQELRRFPGSSPAIGSAWGFAFLLPALGLQIVDTSMRTELLSAVSLIISLPGLSLLVLGVERTRAIAFPLAFSLFGLPIPLSLTERVHLALRHATTYGVTHLLPLTGVTFFSESTTIHVANGTLQIADACSGFSTLYASLAVACFLAYTIPGGLRRLVTIAAAVPIAIGANVLRILLLTLLVAWRGEGILDTWIHPASGMMTFAIALPILFWVAQPPRDSATGVAR